VIEIILQAVILFWIGGIYYAMRKGLNEIIEGLRSIDERLSKLEKLARSTRGPVPECG